MHNISHFGSVLDSPTHGTLGDLRNAEEYRAAKAAWERVVVARIHKQGNGGVDVDVIDGDDYRRAGFSI